jgi:hypothetical protein
MIPLRASIMIINELDVSKPSPPKSRKVTRRLSIVMAVVARHLCYLFSGKSFPAEAAEPVVLTMIVFIQPQNKDRNALISERRSISPKSSVRF